MHRIPQLDGLRAIAILMVFGTHALGIPLLWTGVDLFFVLSGYLITGILLRLKDRSSVSGNGGYWKPFYFHRFRRIIPPYLGFLIVLSLVFQVPWAHLWYWYLFFGANFPVALGKVSVAAMSPLWSLAVEEQFYFIWPWIVLLCNKKTLRQIAGAVIILSPFVRAACTPLFAMHFPIYCLTVFRADTLAAGAFIALSEANDMHWIEKHRRIALAGALGALALFAIFSGAFPSFRTGANSILFNSLGYTFSVLLFGSTLVYTLGLKNGWFYSILTAPHVQYLGRISYTFYLYHLAVLLKVEEHLHSVIPAAVLAFAVTTAIAAISWRFFESPILALNRAETPRGTLTLG